MWIRILFTGATAWAGATFAIGVDSMESDIHPPVHELSLFAVGVFPLGFALRESVLHVAGGSGQG